MTCFVGECQESYSQYIEKTFHSRFQTPHGHATMLQITKLEFIYISETLKSLRLQLVLTNILYFYMYPYILLSSYSSHLNLVLSTYTLASAT